MFNANHVPPRFSRLTEPPWRRCTVSPYYRTVFDDAPCPGGSVSRSLLFSGAAEPSGAPFARCKLFDDIEAHLQDGHDHQLRQAVQRLQRKSGMAAVPGRDHQLALVIGVDQAGAYAKQKASHATGSISAT
jgi:hypothetical protein